MKTKAAWRQQRTLTALKACVVADRVTRYTPSPRRLYSDNGPEFASIVMHDLVIHIGGPDYTMYTQEGIQPADAGFGRERQLSTTIRFEEQASIVSDA